MFAEGASVYVVAKLKPRWQNSEVMDLKVQSVEYLQTVKDKSIDRITISMLTEKLNEQMVDDLCQMIDEHPGKTKLFFQLRDTQGKHHVLLQSKRSTVDVRHTLLEYIDAHDGLDYKIN